MENYNERLISKQAAILLKVIGFESRVLELNNTVFKDNLQYVTQTVAQTYLREKHMFCISIIPTGSWRYGIDYRFEDETGMHWTSFEKVDNERKFYEDYYEALEVGILSGVNVIINNNDELFEKMKLETQTELMKQKETVKQNLTYHFGTSENRNIPDALPFLKEFLNDVEKLCNS